MDKDEIAELLRDLIETQLTDGTWNYDQYMRGMANGMILCLSVITGEEPNYKEDIGVYITDLEKLEKFNKSGAVLNDKKV